MPWVEAWVESPPTQAVCVWGDKMQEGEQVRSTSPELLELVVGCKLGVVFSWEVAGPSSDWIGVAIAIHRNRGTTRTTMPRPSR